MKMNKTNPVHIHACRPIYIHLYHVLSEYIIHVDQTSFEQTNAYTHFRQGIKVYKCVSVLYVYTSCTCEGGDVYIYLARI